VTKEAHCLGDILIKNYDGSLDVDIAAVIGNYDTLQNLTEKFDIPYHHVSHEGLNREEHEQKLLEVLDQYHADYLVLAKYMRVLTPGFVDKYHHKIINIHHSFLPAFIGAKPYQQAYERGVKIIGATAHFVTNDLDEGPIITQDIVPVDHSYTPQMMQRLGQDTEAKVLARAVNLFAERRIFIQDRRTIIL